MMDHTLEYGSFYILKVDRLIFLYSFSGIRIQEAPGHIPDMLPDNINHKPDIFGDIPDRTYRTPPYRGVRYVRLSRHPSPAGVISQRLRILVRKPLA